MFEKKDEQFLEKRRKLNKAWPIVGTIMMISLVILALYLFFSSPLLINPYKVIELIKANKLSPTTMRLMAVIMPVLVIGLLGTVFICIFYTWLFMIIEKRYLKMLDNRDEKNQRQKSDASNEERSPGE